ELGGVATSFGIAPGAARAVEAVALVDLEHRADHAKGPFALQARLHRVEDVTALLLLRYEHDCSPGRDPGMQRGSQRRATASTSVVPSRQVPTHRKVSKTRDNIRRPARPRTVESAVDSAASAYSRARKGGARQTRVSVWARRRTHAP